MLWHEIIHGILEDRGLQLDEDVKENLCEALSRGIYQVLQDNAHKFFAEDFLDTIAQRLKSLEGGGVDRDEYNKCSDR